MNEFDYFKNKIEEQYGISLKEDILSYLEDIRPTTFRINTLLDSKENVVNYLIENGFEILEVDFYNLAFILLNKSLEEIMDTSLFKEGKIYLQSLSSMIPPIILDPKPNKDILDMAAAPGGKTTELAVLTNNKARITAIEMNKIRAERLRYNIDRQHATSVTILNQDARRLDSFFTFDDILLDAPCSGSGTRSDIDDFKGLTETLVTKSTKSQIELLSKAITHLKKGGVLVYSTCSIFKEENEEVIKKVIKDKNVTIEAIDFKSKYIEALPSTLDGVLTIKPSIYTEGFFVCKLRKG